MHEINENILILITILKNEISPRYPLSWTVSILRVFSVTKCFGSLYISSNQWNFLRANDSTGKVDRTTKRRRQRRLPRPNFA